MIKSRFEKFKEFVIKYQDNSGYDKKYQQKFLNDMKKTKNILDIMNVISELSVSKKDFDFFMYEFINEEIFIKKDNYFFGFKTKKLNNQYWDIGFDT